MDHYVKRPPPPPPESGSRRNQQLQECSLYKLTMDEVARVKLPMRNSEMGIPK
jgi:hypothetical protein